MQARTDSPNRFAALPDDETLSETVAALRERGFDTQVVDDLEAAREAVLARIPHGSSVMTNPSVTLEETGIAAAIDEGGAYDSSRMRIGRSTARPSWGRSRRSSPPDFSLGSVQAVTREGTLVIASALGSQLAAYAWGAANVIFVAGAQKLVADVDAARERIFETASRSRPSGRSTPTGRRAASARSSRCTGTTPAAPTWSSSARRGFTGPR